MTIEQISVFLENRSGQLSEVTEVLAENKVDLRAIHIAETADYGVLRLITGDSQAAARILLSRGFILNMTPVVAARVRDEAGGLAALLRVLAHAEIDIEYMYSAFGHRDGSATMVLRVADPKRLEEVLADNGFQAAEDSDLGIA